MSRLRYQILALLKERNIPMSPTEIGMALGKSYNSASSAVNNPLKKLVNAGLVTKTKTGKVRYEITTKGWNSI